MRALSEINRQQFAAAEADIRKAIDVAPQNSFGYVQMGNLKFAQKQYSEAGKAYQRALDLNANSKDALRGLMNTYIAQKQIDGAIAAANAQIAKSPNNSGFYDLLGSVLFRVKKDLNGAEAAFKRSVELDKNNSDAVIKLGQVQAAKRRDRPGDRYLSAGDQGSSSCARILYPPGRAVWIQTGLDQSSGRLSESIGTQAQ